jgi:hypothetical protein
MVLPRVGKRGDGLVEAISYPWRFATASLGWIMNCWRHPVTRLPLFLFSGAAQPVSENTGPWIFFRSIDPFRLYRIQVNIARHLLLVTILLNEKRNTVAAHRMTALLGVDREIVKLFKINMLYLLILKNIICFFLVPEAIRKWVVPRLHGTVQGSLIRCLLQVRHLDKANQSLL